MRVLTRRKRFHGGAKSARAPPPPPPPERKRIQCGTLRQLSEFDLASLAWLRSAPVLAALQGNDDDDNEEEAKEHTVSDAAFWASVREADFPMERNLCTLECKDAQIFFQTMEDWGVDLDHAPDAFMRLVFSGKINSAFHHFVQSAPGPGERAVRQKMLDANTRFADLTSVWGNKLAAAWLVRTAIVVGHPRFDKYAQGSSQMTAAATYASAVVREIALDLELAKDAVAADRVDWLQLLSPKATLHLIQCAIEQHSDACLAHLVETVEMGEEDAEIWVRLRTNAAVYGSDAALKLIDAKYKEKFGTEERDIDPDDSDWMVDINTPLSDAALDGNAARMKLLVQLGCPVDHFVASYAVASGDEATVAYCRELVPLSIVVDQLEDVGLVSLGSVFDAAAGEHGALEPHFRTLRRVVLQVKRGARYVRSLQIPLSPYLCEAAIDLCMESPPVVVERCLLAVHGMGMPWPVDPDWFDRNFGHKFQANRLPFLKWMHERGLKIDGVAQLNLRAVHGDAAIDSVIAARNAVRAIR